MMLPGLGDAHNHHTVAAIQELFEIEFSPTSTLEEILAHVSAQAATPGPDEWITGGSRSSELLGQINTSKTLAALDLASQGRPVMLRDDSLHARWANTKALEIAGVHPDSVDPEGGAFLRDPDTGAISGIMVGTACAVVNRAMAKSVKDGAARLRSAAKRAVEIVNSYGITCYQDASSVEPIARALNQLDVSGELNAWATITLVGRDTLSGADLFGEALFALRDRAVKDTLDAIEIVRELNGDGPLHQIAHPGYVAPEDVARFARLNVVADLCPAIWVPSPIINAILDVVPQPQASRIGRSKSLPMRVS